MKKRRIRRVRTRPGKQLYDKPSNTKINEKQHIRNKK